MAVNTVTNTIKLEAVEAAWGRETCRSIEFIDDVAGALTGEYFELNVIDTDFNKIEYYVLLSGTTPAVDPALAGKTKIEISYSDGDTKETLAGLFVAALASHEVRIIENLAGKVTYENIFLSASGVEDVSNASSLTYELIIDGTGGKLGATASGGSSMNMEVQTFDLKSDQSAEFLLGQVNIGVSGAVEMSLIEMSKERWETIVGSVTGDIFTPSSGTRLVGYGDSKSYQDLFNFAGKLVLHPIRLPNTDRTEDVVLWKCAPVPASINFSGTDQQAMEVSFNAYLDQTKPSEIRLLSQGDWTQELV